MEAAHAATTLQQHNSMLSANQLCCDSQQLDSIQLSISAALGSSVATLTHCGSGVACSASVAAFTPAQATCPPSPSLRNAGSAPAGVQRQNSDAQPSSRSGTLTVEGRISADASGCPSSSQNKRGFAGAAAEPSSKRTRASLASPSAASDWPAAEFSGSGVEAQGATACAAAGAPARSPLGGACREDVPDDEADTAGTALSPDCGPSAAAAAAWAQMCGGGTPSDNDAFQLPEFTLQDLEELAEHMAALDPPLTLQLEQLEGEGGAASSGGGAGGDTAALHDMLARFRATPSRGPSFNFPAGTSGANGNANSANAAGGPRHPPSRGNSFEFLLARRTPGHQPSFGASPLGAGRRAPSRGPSFGSSPLLRGLLSRAPSFTLFSRPGPTRNASFGARHPPSRGNSFRLLALNPDGAQAASLDFSIGDDSFEALFGDDAADLDAITSLPSPSSTGGDGSRVAEKTGPPAAAAAAAATLAPFPARRRRVSDDGPTAGPAPRRVVIHRPPGAGAKLRSGASGSASPLYQSHLHSVSPALRTPEATAPSAAAAAPAPLSDLEAEALTRLQARIAQLSSSSRAAVRSRLANVAASFRTAGRAAQQLADAPSSLHANLLRMVVTGRKPDTGFDGRRLKEQLGAAVQPRTRALAAAGVC